MAEADGNRVEAASLQKKEKKKPEWVTWFDLTIHSQKKSEPDITQASTLLAGPNVNVLKFGAARRITP